jgi:hypothetical protein
MKLTVTPVVIEKGEGFTLEKDIFARKQFAEKLTNLIRNTEDELVIALDAKWGEGKTTFVKMWQGMMGELNIRSIYFDAFENDFIEDPLLALSGEMFSLIEDSDSQYNFKTKAISAIKVISRAGLRIGIKALTAGVLDETIFDDTGAIQDASTEASGIVDKYIGDRLMTLESDKASLKAFKEAIGCAVESLSGSDPLIFIIDELDRCKPTFALDTIERIKHVFSVPKVVFVLVMNRRQLEEIIKIKYGQNVEASLYLQKFVHVWVELPRNAEKYNSHGKTYLRKCLDDMGFKHTQNNDEAIKLYGELIDYYRLSFRDIERSLTNFALVENLTGGDLEFDYYYLLVFLSIIRTTMPEIYVKIKQGHIEYDGENGLLAESKISALKDDNLPNEYSETHYLKWLIKHDLSSIEEAREMEKKLGHNIGSGRSGKMITICSWLERFQLQ